MARLYRYRAEIAVQLDSISTFRVLDPMVTLPSGLPESSTTHIRSPTRNVLLDTLFELTELCVPLENPGFSP
jgi:hypothetical protein